MEIIWTKHAEVRQTEWERKLGITHKEVEELIADPEQLVPGDLGTYIAQMKRGNGLLRVVFVEMRERRKVLTLYWTSKIEKYWQGG